MNNVKLPERDKVEIWNKVEIRNKLLEFSPFAFEMDKWYRLKVIARDNRFQVFVDKKKMLDFFDNTYTEGRVYLSSGIGNRVHFDDFEVRWGGALSVQPRRKLTTTWGQIKGSCPLGGDTALRRPMCNDNKPSQTTEEDLKACLVK